MLPNQKKIGEHFKIRFYNDDMIIRVFLKIFVFFVILITLYLSCSNPEKAVLKRRKTPNFVLKDLNGNEFKLSDENGKVVVMEFLLTTCPVCKSTFPYLINLYNEFKDDSLIVVGIVIDSEDPSAALRLKKDYNIPFPLLLDTIDVNVAYGVMEVPTIVVVDKEGWIAYEFVGGLTPENINSIKNLLK